MRISVLAYDRCLAAEVFGLADVLLFANRLAGLRRSQQAAPFEVSVIGAREGAVTAAGGVSLGVSPAPAACDLLVVPAFEVVSAAELDEALSKLGPEVSLIRRAAARGAVAAICGGAFLLGEAGVLDGRRATTAWAFAGELARRYPAADVLSDALLVRDGSVTTSGAFSAAHDLALALVRERLGEGAARTLAKVTLLDAGRTSQAPYLDPRLHVRARNGFSQSASRWLSQRLAEPYSLERLAQALNVSSRTLLRRFKAQTGRTPLDHLQDLRIGRAKQLLEASDLRLGEVAREVGYLDLATFTRLFARKAQITPAAYRRRFRTRLEEEAN